MTPEAVSRLQTLQDALDELSRQIVRFPVRSGQNRCLTPVGRPGHGRGGREA